MTLKRRLGRLEPFAVGRWHEAWERLAAKQREHTENLTLTKIDDIKVLLPDITEADLDDAGWNFACLAGFTNADDFMLWFKAYDLPDNEPPDLTKWPDTIPVPPAELPGTQEKIEPYLVSEDVLERACAQASMFLLASARAVREFQAVP